MSRKYRVIIQDGTTYEGYLHDDGELETVSAPTVEKAEGIEMRLNHITGMGIYMNAYNIESFKMKKI